MTPAGDGIVLLSASIALGLLVGAWFYGGLAVASQNAPGGPLAAGRRVPRGVLDAIGLMAVLLGVSLLLGLPVVLLIGFTALISPPVAALGSLMLLVGLLFATVYLFFSVPAISLQRRAAAGDQAQCRHGTPTPLGQSCVDLADVADPGWHGPGLGAAASYVPSPYGVLLGILGTPTTVASGLIAAGMVFYIQRSEPVSASGAVQLS